jgi:outer membrane lipoprotein SlyB
VLNAPTLNLDPSGENIFTGVMGGATVGSLAGPVGTVAGAVVGGLLGLVAGQLLWDNVVEPLLPKRPPGQKKGPWPPKNALLPPSNNAEKCEQ